MFSTFADSPFGKYVQAIRSSPPGYYNAHLLLTVTMFALSGMPKGWDEGTTASLTQLKGFQHTFQVTPKNNPEAISNIVSLVNLGAGIGAFLSFFLNDRIGRIWSYRTYMTIYIIGNLVETFSYGNLGALYFARIFGGLGVGALTVTGPMAIVEIAPETTRGLMTLWFNICMLGSQFLGVFVVYGVNKNVSPTTNLQWQIPFFVQTFVPTIGIIMSLFLSESPRWLALRGRVDDARKVLLKLRGTGPEHPAFQQEFDRIVGASVVMNAEYGGRSDWDIIRETFTKRSNLRRVQLTLVAYLLAQMSGANAITNYLPEIFGLIGVAGEDTRIFATGFYSLAKVVFALMASLFLVDVIGRRKSLFTGATIQMICHAYLAGYLEVYTTSPSSVPKGASDAAIAAIFIHAFGWAIGLLTLPYVFGAELWPNHLRSLGGAISQSFHWLFYFAIVKALPALLSSMDTWGAFLFFAVWCAIAIVYAYILVPETAGRALENIDELFERPWYMMRKAAVAKVQDDGESAGYDDVGERAEKEDAMYKEYAPGQASSK